MRSMRLAFLPTKAAAYSEAICKRLLEHPAFRKARTVMLYSPIHSEVDVTPVANAALKAGKVVAMPSIRKNSIVPKAYSGGSLRKGKYGIPEPMGTKTIDAETIGFVAVPGIAFDLNGNRIGFGAGHYDAFLKKAANAHRIGVAYDFQVVPRLPKEPHDEPMDEVLTERRAIRCKLHSAHK